MDYCYFPKVMKEAQSSLAVVMNGSSAFPLEQTKEEISLILREKEDKCTFYTLVILMCIYSVESDVD